MWRFLRPDYGAPIQTWNKTKVRRILPGMITRSIHGVCFIAAVGSLAIGFAGHGWSLMSAEDVLVVPLVVGPYAIIAALAGWRRSSRKESIFLLAVVLLVSIYGLWSFGASAYRRHVDPRGGMAMDLNSLVVPAFQWFAVTILAAAFGVAAVVRSKVSNH